MNLGNFEFHTPEALVLLALLALLPEVRQRWRKSEKRDSLPHIMFPLPPGFSPQQTLRQRVRKFLPGIRALILSLLILALARPQRLSSFQESEDSARDIMLTLDISGSMQAMDFSLNDNAVDRLTALKAVTKQFIDGRPGDRFGLVVFSEQAFTQCPLTTDHEVVKQFIDRLEIGMAGQGTAIGDALGISLKRIKDLPAESKVIVLVTDGKNNFGSLSPLESAAMGKKLGVRIHTIGIGGSGFAPMPVPGLFGSTRFVQRRMEYDEGTLKQVAQITGGTYFNARNTDALAQIYSQIDSLELRRDKSYHYVHRDELFEPLLLIGAFLFLFHELLRATALRELPDI